MLGKLGLSAIPFSQPIPLITSVVIMLIGLGVLALITVKGWWPYLWREWITSVDHKRIGVMYSLLGVVMLIRGFVDAIMMRTQQAAAINAPGYLPPEHYDQIFTAHGTIMILFGAMPLMLGFMNFLVPLQLGVRDVAFPTFNSVGFWLTASGALLVNISLFVGEFARTGWLPYPPLSETTYTPGVGVDYYLWAVQISGIGTLITGINIVTTVLKMRCPGMSYLRMPIFCWTALAACLLIVAAFPILTATLAMLTLDRYAGWHYFTNTAGGNPMMFVNLVWAWGHPEVYILVLPAFGVFSEIFPAFSGKPCSAIVRWSPQRSSSAWCRCLSGCIISSRWGRARRSIRSSAFPPPSSRSAPASKSTTGPSPYMAGACASRRRCCGRWASSSPSRSVG